MVLTIFPTFLQIRKAFAIYSTYLFATKDNNNVDVFFFSPLHFFNSGTTITIIYSVAQQLQICNGGWCGSGAATSLKAPLEPHELKNVSGGQTTQKQRQSGIG